MKHIPQGQEPAGLAAYRQNHPHGTWDDFKNEVLAYQALLDEIKNRQYGLCAYCEIDLKNDGVTVDQLVEHFHPKQDSNQYHNWGLDFISKFLSPPTKNTLWPFFTTIRLYFGTEGEKFLLQNDSKPNHHKEL